MRAELKYLVPDSMLPDLRRRIEPFVCLDKHPWAAGKQGYTVRSIYLDSPQLTYYHEKVEGLKNRKKLRIRGYNEFKEQNQVFLEIKRKIESVIFKHRAPLSFEHLGSLFVTGDIDRFVDPDREFPKARDDARRFFYHVYRHNLRPSTLVTYEREAYAGRFDSSLRITFDMNLRGALSPPFSELYSEQGVCLAHPGYTILEVKFNTRFPAWFTPLVGEFGLRKQALSKYVICLDRAKKQAGKKAIPLAAIRYATNHFAGSCQQAISPTGVVLDAERL